MNVVAKHTATGAVGPLDLGLFHDAVFKLEFAVYVIRFDAKGIPLFEQANDTVTALGGRPLKKIVGQRPIDCLPPEIGECLETRLASCYASGEPVLYERTVEGPDGTLAFRTHLIPITGRFGTVEHVVGITRDVSVEANQVREAQQNAALLQRLGIALPSAIYLLNIQDNAIRFIGGDPDPVREQWRAQAEAAGSE